MDPHRRLHRPNRPIRGPKRRWGVPMGLAIGLLCLPGCFTGSSSVGSPLAFTADCSNLLRVGSTTRSDVLEMFGSPTEIRSTREGDVFRYLYHEIRRSAVDVGLSTLFGLVSVSLFRSESDRQATENLTVFFSEQGKLLSWSYTPLVK